MGDQTTITQVIKLPGFIPPPNLEKLRRDYLLHLRRPYREDMVFEGWRLEQLLDRMADPKEVRAALAKDGITHLLVHHAFFLMGGNADLEPGRTVRLRQRFDALVRLGLLQPVRAWGPVTLYAVPPT